MLYVTRTIDFIIFKYSVLHGDICKHLGIDSSTDHPHRYSNLFLNAYINRHVHAEYLKMIYFYSPLGIWHVFLYSINTNIYHFQSMKYRQYVSTYTFTSVVRKITMFTCVFWECSSINHYTQGAKKTAVCPFIQIRVIRPGQ